MKNKLVNPYNEIIVEKIRAICKERKTPYTSLTKLEVALGMGNGVLGGWKYSKKSPPVDTLHQIASLLDVPVSSFMPDPLSTLPSFEEIAARTPEERAQAEVDDMAALGRATYAVFQQQINGNKKSPAGEGEALSEKKMELFHIFDQLDEEQQSILLSMAKQMQR